MIELPPPVTYKKPIAARLFCLAVLAFPCAHAQPPALTAEEAVRLTLARPEAAHVIDSKIDMARGELMAASTWPNPELSLERMTVGRPGHDGDETSFLLSQEFDLSGRRALQQRAAELGLSTAEVRATAERHRIRIEVLRRYYAVVAALHRVDAYRAWSRDLDELARVAAGRGEAGDISGYESRRIEQSGELARIRLEEVDIALRAALERLASLIGAEADKIAIDHHADLLPELSRFDHRLDDEPLVNAELAALDSRRLSTAAAAKAASRAALPVTLGLGQRRLEHATGTDTALLMEISLPLPFFDRNQAAHARAQAESRHADNLYRLTLLDMQSRREAALAEAERLVTTAQRLRAQVLPQARDLTAIARSSFAEGELDLVGLLAALDAEMAAVDQSLDIQQRARAAWLELEQLTRPDIANTGEMP